MKTEWTEDADLGVAVREVGRARYMQIRPLTPEGRMRIYNALATLPNSLWQYGRERRDLRLRDNIIEIDPAHRLAFARALDLPGRFWPPVQERWAVPKNSPGRAFERKAVSQ